MFIGKEFTATKHSVTGDNVLTTHMNTPAVEKWQSTDALNGFSASWNYAGTVYDSYSTSPSVADAAGIFGLLFNSDGS